MILKSNRMRRTELKKTVFIMGLFLEIASLAFSQSGQTSKIKLANIVEGKTIAICGYAAKLVGVTKSKDSASVKSIIVAPIAGLNPKSVTFSGMKVSAGGVSEYPKTQGEFVFSFSGWTMSFTELTLTEEGIKGSGVLDIGGSAIEFPDAVIGLKGKMTSGKSAPGSFARVHGINILIENSELRPSGAAYLLFVKKAVLPLDDQNGSELVFSPLSLSSDGIPVSPVLGSGNIEFETEEGYRVIADRYTLDKRGVFLSGILALSSHDAPSDITCAVSGRDFWIELLSNGSIRSIDVIPNATIHYAGWEIVSKKVSVEWDQVVCESTTMKYGNVTIPFNQIVFDGEGYIVDGGKGSERMMLPIFNGRTQMIEYVLYEEGIAAKAFVKLPETMSGYAILFDELTLLPDGTFRCEETVPRFEFSIGDISCVLEDIWIDKDGLYANDCTIIFPQSMEKKELYSDGLMIGNDGKIGPSARYSPFQLWGMSFHINNLQFGKDELIMTGTVWVLEGDFGIIISGIDDLHLVVSDSGHIKALSAAKKIDEWMPSIFPQVYFMKCESVQVAYDKKPWIVFKNPVVWPTNGLYAFDVRLKDVRLDPNTMKWDFDSMKAASTVHFMINGCDFNMDVTRLSPEDGIVMRGTVLLANSETLGSHAGKKLTLDFFSMTPEGKLGMIVIGDKGVSENDRETIRSLLEKE
jgi:hypothetical protein